MEVGWGPHVNTHYPAALIKDGLPFSKTWSPTFLRMVKHNPHTKGMVAHNPQDGHPPTVEWDAVESKTGLPKGQINTN